MTGKLEHTFNEVYTEYERWRPTYPAELYRDIFAYKAISKNSSALEIGIGTGQATAPILETGCYVSAVELGADLAEFSKSKFSSFNNFHIINSPFQNFECKDEAFDLIYSATAFHWIPEEYGYKRVYELLKHGGAFARFANHPYPAEDCIDIYEAIQKIYAKYMPSSAAPAEYCDKQAKAVADIAAKYGFTEIKYSLYRRTRVFSSDGYTSLLKTYSDHIAMNENIKKAFHSEIKDAIDSFGGVFKLCDTIDLELARKE